MILHPIQSISGIGDSCYFGDQPLVCLTDQYASAFGSEGLFGLLVGVCIFMAFYVAGDGDMATPTVALILTGSVLVPTLPGQYAQIGMYVVVIGLAAALWQVMQKYVLSPATQ
jgi:membrane-bound ClpP family serine protease